VTGVPPTMSRPKIALLVLIGLALLAVIVISPTEPLAFTPLTTPPATVALFVSLENHAVAVPPSVVRVPEDPMHTILLPST